MKGLLSTRSVQKNTLKLLFWWMKEVLRSIRNLHIEKHAKNTTKTTFQAVATGVKMWLNYWEEKMSITRKHKRTCKEPVSSLAFHNFAPNSRRQEIWNWNMVGKNRLVREALKHCFNASVVTWPVTVYTAERLTDLSEFSLCPEKVWLQP